MLGTILIIILILLLIGALPNWGYSSGWGYYPGGGLGIILIIVIIVVLDGDENIKRKTSICRLKSVLRSCEGDLST